MMKFKLPNIDLTGYYKVYAGRRSRYATATAVCFIDDNLIAVASYLGKVIYLIDISKDPVIIDEIKTTYHPDLMDYKDGIIMTSNRAIRSEFCCISVYKVDKYYRKLSFVKDIVRKDFNQFHGCRIIDQDNVIITNTDTKRRECLIFNLPTGEYEVFKNFDYYPKDLLLLLNNRLLLATSDSRPSLDPIQITDSILYLYELPSFKKLAELPFYGQTDCLALTGENGFITLQGQDSLLHFILKNDKLENKGEIKRFDFPHGIASKGDKVIVTNYGDNSIDILNINELC